MQNCSTDCKLDGEVLVNSSRETIPYFATRITTITLYVLHLDRLSYQYLPLVSFPNRFSLLFKFQMSQTHRVPFFSPRIYGVIPFRIDSRAASRLSVNAIIIA